MFSINIQGSNASGHLHFRAQRAAVSFAMGLLPWFNATFNSYFSHFNSKCNGQDNAVQHAVDGHPQTSAYPISIVLIIKLIDIIK